MICMHISYERYYEHTSEDKFAILDICDSCHEILDYDIVMSELEVPSDCIELM